MADVARLAGVSLKTASRVFNREPHVTAATADKVHAAAGQLGFRPNVIARELANGGRSTTVGLIIGDVANPFYARLARGVEKRLRRSGLQLITASSDEDPGLEEQITNEMLERRVRGLLLVTCVGDHRSLETDRRHGVPVAFLDRPPVGIAADTVTIDNRRGARMATRHLLAQGHRRIGLVEDFAALPTHRERFAGFEHEMNAAAVDDWLRYVRSESHDSLSAARSVAELMALPEPPTALFTTNNRITVGALGALRDLPDPPALVGFDDFELAELLDVTVISHSPEDMGEIGAERVLARLDDADAPPHEDRLPVTLVERGSGERPPP
jgi:LacI family transcriptional regulator